jgi:hypothetical protein
MGCGCNKNKSGRSYRNNASPAYIGRAVSAAANPLLRSTQANAAFSEVTTTATNNERKRIEALRMAAIRQQFGK